MVEPSCRAQPILDAVMEKSRWCMQALEMPWTGYRVVCNRNWMLHAKIGIAGSKKSHCGACNRTGCFMEKIRPVHAGWERPPRHGQPKLDAACQTFTMVQAQDRPAHRVQTETGCFKESRWCMLRKATASCATETGCSMRKFTAVSAGAEKASVSCASETGCCMQKTYIGECMSRNATYSCTYLKLSFALCRRGDFLAVKSKAYSSRMSSRYRQCSLVMNSATSVCIQLSTKGRITNTFFLAAVVEDGNWLGISGKHRMRHD